MEYLDSFSASFFCFLVPGFGAFLHSKKGIRNQDKLERKKGLKKSEIPLLSVSFNCPVEHITADETID